MENSAGKQYHISDIVMVKCRICVTTMRRKNYKAHLKKIHPKANSENMSGWSQPKISNMFPIANASQTVVSVRLSIIDKKNLQNTVNFGEMGQSQT